MSGCIALLLTAAGSSQRFGLGKKELLRIGERTVLDLSLRAFLGAPGLSSVCITTPIHKEKEVQSALAQDTYNQLLQEVGDKVYFCQGGATRQLSVLAGLEMLALHEKNENCLVLVHDAARPWCSPSLVMRVIFRAQEIGTCIPLVPLDETPKTIATDLGNPGNSGWIRAHPLRKETMLAQTPQCFNLHSLLDAYRKARVDNFECTDEAALWEKYKGKVGWILGDISNKKITYYSDVPTPALANTHSLPSVYRTGLGWDSHALVAGRPLLLGGVAIHFDKGEAGYSDGDVLLHAIIDSLLGAVSLGDIGSHFPPTNSRWKDADSRQLLATVIALVRERGWELENLDCTIILEKPHLRHHIDAIRASIALVLKVDMQRISVKAKTAEGFGSVGSGIEVQAQALCLVKGST